MDIPVLFVCFARPEYARRTFQAIKAAKPKTLYFYSNKARENDLDEIKRNEECRSLIKEVDWDCCLHKWLCEDSVNVYDSLNRAFSWIFEHEAKAIIIEEDCLPSLAFFDFEEQMLNKYQEDHRVWMVCGSNFFEDFNPHGHDYLFSRYPMGWGWGAWRDRWQTVNWNNVKLDVNDMISEGVTDAVYSLPKEVRMQTKLWSKDADFARRTKCWDSVFTKVLLAMGGVVIFPSRKLVQNIGLEGVHTRHDSEKSYLHSPVTYKEPKYQINSEPHYVLADVLYDRNLWYNHFYKRTLLSYRVKNKIKSGFNKIGYIIKKLIIK